MKSKLIALLSAAVLLATPIFSQVNASGTFSGQVTDQTGAGIASAQVKVTEQQTGVVETRTTGADGYYTVPLMKPGIYTHLRDGHRFQHRDPQGSDTPNSAGCAAGF